MATLLTLAYVTSFEALYESTFRVLRNEDDDDAATRRLLGESPLAPYLNPDSFADNQHNAIPLDAFQQAMSDYSEDCGNMRMANLPQWKQDVQRVSIFNHYLTKFLP